MTTELAFYLMKHTFEVGSKFDYRLTAVELYELGASDEILLEFQEWLDNKQIGG